MLHAAAEAVENAEVRAIITSPRVHQAQLKDLMLAVCGGDKLGKSSAQNFIKLLVEDTTLDVVAGNCSNV